MVKKRVILVTGVADFWGSRVANQLLAQSQYHVIGLDKKPPKEFIKGLDFIQADTHNSLLLELIKSENIDTLVHLGFIEDIGLSEEAFDNNVIGTMKLLSAADKAGVRKIILRSSTTVYGANPNNPAFLREDYPLHETSQPGFIRDLVEIESFCNDFRAQARQVIFSVLRFPNLIGATVDSPMTRFLKPAVVPVLLGFAPRLQFIHENDAIDAICHAIENDKPGVYNIAAEGIFSLDKLLAFTGRIPLPVFHSFLYWGRSAIGNANIENWMPIELDFLRYPCIADIQKMRDEFGFVPKYSAKEALREFTGFLRSRNYLPRFSLPSHDQERLRDTIERRNRMRLRNQPTEIRQDLHDAEQEEE